MEIAAWSQTIENYIVRVYQESGELLNVGTEEPNIIDVYTLKADPNKPEDMKVDAVNAQVHAEVTALTSNEAFDFVLDAWSRAGLQNGGVSMHIRKLRGIARPKLHSRTTLRNLKRESADITREVTVKERS